MTNGFFGRLARKWWLMLVLGVVVGLAAGLPVGGNLMPEKLAGTVIEDVITVKVGNEFKITKTSSILNYYNPYYLSLSESPKGTFTFRALRPTGEGFAFVIFDLDAVYFIKIKMG